VDVRRDAIRVACVGDSITYGLGIGNRRKDCYPAQLARMLGTRYEVRNFGVSGATMLRNGLHPYWDTARFSEASAYNPNMVVIMLGTNDTAPYNWWGEDEFARDCGEMIDHFIGLPAKPRVWNCLPPPVFDDSGGTKNGAIPVIERVAREKGIAVIDLSTPLSGRPDLFPDGLHPNAEGSMIMAQEVYRALRTQDGMPISGQQGGRMNSP